jgi:hypothetical protein
MHAQSVLAGLTDTDTAPERRIGICQAGRLTSDAMRAYCLFCICQSANSANKACIGRVRARVDGSPWSAPKTLARTRVGTEPAALLETHRLGVCADGRLRGVGGYCWCWPDTHLCNPTCCHVSGETKVALGRFVADRRGLAGNRRSPAGALAALLAEAKRPFRVRLVESITNVCLVTAPLPEALDERLSGYWTFSFPALPVTVRRRNLCLVQSLHSRDLDGHHDVQMYSEVLARSSRHRRGG